MNKLSEESKRVFLGHPENPVLEENLPNSQIAELFSRKQLDIPDLLPEGLKYIRPLGAGSWKESHLVEAKVGSLTIQYVLKIINPSEFAKRFRNADNIDSNKYLEKEFLGGNPNSLEGLAYAVPFVLNNKQTAMLEEYLPTGINEVAGKKSLEKSLEDIIGFAKGIRSAHKDLNLVLEDIKPEHFRYDSKGIPKIFDFGSTSKSDWTEGMKESGDFLYTLNGKNSTSKQDNIYSFGATMYYFLTGEHLKLDLFNSVTSEYSTLDEKINHFKSYLAKAPTKEIDSYTTKKLKKVPKPLRETLSKMLLSKNYNSIKDGVKLVEELEKVKENLIVKKYFKNQLNKYWRQLVITPLIASSFLGIAYLETSYEPKDLSLPASSTNMVIDNLPKSSVRFKEEKTYQMKKSFGTNKKDLRKFTTITNNLNVLNLLVSYTNTMDELGVPRQDYVSQAQVEQWFANHHSGSNMYENRFNYNLKIIAENIEIGMNAVNNNNVVDLEDMMVIAKCGLGTYTRAKIKAEQKVENNMNPNSSVKPYNYAFYSQFLPAKDKKFIDTWLANTKNIPIYDNNKYSNNLK